MLTQTKLATTLRTQWIKHQVKLKLQINFSTNKLSANRLYTFPALEQFGHLSAVGTCKGRPEAEESERGLILKHTPLAEHRAQAK